MAHSMFRLFVIDYYSTVKCFKRNLNRLVDLFYFAKATENVNKIHARKKVLFAVVGS